MKSVFLTASPNRNLPSFRKAGVVLAGTVIAIGTGTLLVKAADDPRLHRAMLEFNRPLRVALEPLIVRRERPLVEVAREREMRTLEVIETRREARAPAPPVLPQGMGLATQPEAPSPEYRPIALPPPLVLPKPALPTQQPADAGPLPRVKPQTDTLAERRGRIRMQGRGLGYGMPVPTNYCVRLCDGFAFPIGETGIGQQSQELICRSACPGADTALYVLPAGSQDLSTMARGGVSYTALPTAYRYQQKVSTACSCRPVGSTQSANAFYRDITLKPGDVVMTSTGAQHFDGAPRFPYRPTHFSEAVQRLKAPREVAIIRGMEAATVRGAFSSAAPPALKARIIAEFRQAERQAVREGPSRAPSSQPGRFVELQPANPGKVTLLPVVRKAPSFTALN